MTKQTDTFNLFVNFFVCVWIIYLVADTFVTPLIRIPIPPVFALAAIIFSRAPSPSSIWSLFQPPRWIYPLIVVFAIAAIREPSANALYFLVMITTVALFRRLAPDVNGYVHLAKLFYGVLIASSLLLVFSYIFPVIGLGIRVALFGQGVLERPFPAGFSQLVHIYGYQVAALGGIAVVLAVYYLQNSPGRLFRAVLTLMHAAVIGLMGMQRSAVLGILIAGAFIARRFLSKRLLYWSVNLILISLVLLILAPSTTYFDQTIIGKDKQDTTKSMRFELQKETLDIILEHPWGLIAEGRKWDQELFRWGGALSSTGLSGHNAYLMTIAYLGIPALSLIWLTFVSAIKSMRSAGMFSLTGDAGPWPAAMAAALVATLFNALFHNASIFSAEGSTLFLYIAVCHWRDISVQKGDSP